MISMAQRNELYQVSPTETFLLTGTGHLSLIMGLVDNKKNTECCQPYALCPPHTTQTSVEKQKYFLLIKSDLQ